VAQGRTNRQVAAALFLTEHTVETVLSRVYRKLGFRLRAELTRRFARGTGEAPPARNEGSADLVTVVVSLVPAGFAGGSTSRVPAIAPSELDAGGGKAAGACRSAAFTTSLGRTSTHDVRPSRRNLRPHLRGGLT